MVDFFKKLYFREEPGFGMLRHILSILISTQLNTGYVIFQKNYQENVKNVLLCRFC